MSQVLEPRTYRREECAVFRKTNEAYGGLSNMAPGFPVRINGVLILTVEALYQACRFPHMPEVQRRILEQHSPMTAKMVSKPYRDDSRPDWDRVRVKIMRWCLRLKLLMHRSSFSGLLLSTGDRPIVEDSRKDDFWGALRVDSKTLVGRNVLGRLLMELREEIKSGAEHRFLEPPAIPSFLLYGQAIGLLDFRSEKEIQRSQMVDKVQVPMNVPSQPLFPELFPESKSENSSFANPQQGGSQEYNLLRGAQPYAEYKESGLPWLGRVPEHWDLLPNRGLIRRRKVLVGKYHRDYRLLSLTKQGVIVRDISTGKGKFSADMGTSQQVRNGDLVFCLFDVPETPRTVGLSRHDGMITGAYTVFESLERGNREYFELFYRAMDDRKLLSPLYSGLRHTIPAERFLGTKTPQPSLQEQDAIVLFLRWANGRLERAIRAKRKVIALLNEQKQAIIHRAVTRGLAPSVPLKSSGISWLGDIPQHWIAPRVKQCARKISKGTTPSTEGREILEFGPVRFLKAENIRAGHVTDKPLCFIDEETNRIISRSQLAENDVLFVIAGATLGKTAVVPANVLPANTNQAVAFIRPNTRIVPNFLELWLQSSRIKELIWLNAVQSAQPNLSMADLGNFAIPVPPIEEQKQILEFVHSATDPISNAISRLEREIDLLREYRTRLVADVVTGKLDVREAAAKLPIEEQAIEPEELVEDDSEMIEDEITEPVG